jgi:hypothetical protein
MKTVAADDDILRREGNNSMIDSMIVTARPGLIRCVAVSAAVLAFSPVVHAQETPAPDEIRAIAEEAAIYALPMVMDYDVLYEYAVDTASSQYKAPFNQLYSEARVATPADTAVVTPNSDTPYSLMWLDLRAEPIVLCVPEIAKDRYYSIQLISQYTYNFGYIGSRATGNSSGCYAVAGPEWTGDRPDGIGKLFQSETQFALAIYRTQLFDPADIEKVKVIQGQYKVQPLSAFLGEPAPAAAPTVEWPKMDKAMGAADPFGYLAFLLQFAPATGPAAVEAPLRARFASIGIEPGKPFSTDGLSAESRTALEDGTKAGAAKVATLVSGWGEEVNGWRLAKDGFGDRSDLGDNYSLRAAAAMNGIFGNDAAEALYPLTRLDGDGEPLDGSKASYTLTFPPGQLPPVNSFWSVTMYDGKTQLLVANPLDRYLINSPMLPQLTKDADGGVTLYIQKDKPIDPDQAANWLPAPDGPIYLVMRLYWPKEAALDGSWTPPAVRRVDG